VRFTTQTLDLRACRECESSVCVTALEDHLGIWALRFLILGLAITPLRPLGGPSLIPYRRAIGLLAFVCAALHLTFYLWLDQGFDMAAILVHRRIHSLHFEASPKANECVKRCASNLLILVQFTT
jgi:hypothetical protein